MTCPLLERSELLQRTRVVGMRRPLRGMSYDVPFILFYSEENNMGWFLLGLILFATVPIIAIFGCIAADLLGIKKGDEL